MQTRKPVNIKRDTSRGKPGLHGKAAQPAEPAEPVGPPKLAKAGRPVEAAKPPKLERALKPAAPASWASEACKTKLCSGTDTASTVEQCCRQRRGRGPFSGCLRNCVLLGLQSGRRNLIFANGASHRETDGRQCSAIS